MVCKNEHPCQGTVLIVDDSTTNCELCQIYLELEGFRVHIAKNGHQGLSTIRQLHPDVVLLDIMMPIMDGFQMLERLRDDPVTRDIPVLVHSVRNETRAVVKALQMGANDFLKKPFDVSELIVRVKKLVAAKQAQDELRVASEALVKRQQIIDVALKKLKRDAEAFRNGCKTDDINTPAATSAAFTPGEDMTGAEQVLHLVNRILELNRYSLGGLETTSA